MVFIVFFNLKYFSQNFIKLKMLRVFHNPHDEQIPKLSLEVQFDQEFMEKTWKTSNRKDCSHTKFSLIILFLPYNQQEQQGRKTEGILAIATFSKLFVFYLKASIMDVKQ